MGLTGRARILAVASGLGALVLAGCQWQSPRYDAAGTGHNTAESVIGPGNVAALAEQARIALPGPFSGRAPVVSGDTVLVTTGGPAGRLWAFDLGGCSGSPASCLVWQSASTGATTQPAVAGDRVYVSIGGQLQVFDADGVDGCSGSPVSCQPLWTAATAGSVVVADGTAFVSGSSALSAFDAAGVAGCSGTPTVCTPRWTFPTSLPVSPAAVSDGVVYVGVDDDTTIINGGHTGTLFALDSHGVEGCSGTPVVCTPLWWAEPPPTDFAFGGVLTSPAVSDGRVFVSDYYSAEDEEGAVISRARLRAFDAAACLADPDHSCAPSWSASLGRFAGITVGDGFVHATGSSRMLTFPVSGGPSCGGTTLCTAVRVSPTTGTASPLPALANGLLYSGRNAFDAAGTGCSAAAPPSCPALWTAPVTSTTSQAVTTVTNGRVLVHGPASPTTSELAIYRP